MPSTDVPGWNCRCSPTCPEEFARFPLRWSSSGVATTPAASTTAFASTRNDGPGVPVNGATTRPETPVTRRPFERICSTRTEVSTCAPSRIAAGT